MLTAAPPPPGGCAFSSAVRRERASERASVLLCACAPSRHYPFSARSPCSGLFSLGAAPSGWKTGSRNLKRQLPPHPTPPPPPPLPVWLLTIRACACSATTLLRSWKICHTKWKHLPCKSRWQNTQWSLCKLSPWFPNHIIYELPVAAARLFHIYCYL